MEEMYADALKPGQNRDETLRLITWKSERLNAELKAKNEAEAEAGNASHTEGGQVE